MSLSKRLYLIITGASLFVGLLVFIVSYEMFSSALEEQFLERIRVVAKNFAASASIGLVFHDTALVARVAEPLLKDPNVVGVEVTDAEGNAVVSLGKRSPHVINIPIRSGGAESLMFSPEQQKRLLGTVRLFYSKRKLEEALRRLLVGVLVVTLMVVVAANLLAHTLVSKAALVPLKELLDAVRKVAAGDLDVAISGGGLPETRELAQAFCLMVNSLKEHQKMLKRTYEEMARNQSLAEIGKFSLTIAHEIKNPLGIIKGSLDILKKEEVDAETKRQMVEFVEEEVKRIDVLINDFLQLSRPEKVSKRRVNARVFLESLAEKLSLYESVGELKVDAPDAEIETAPHLLERVLVNLIKNGFEAGATLVEVKMEEKEESWVIRVSDNGRGIPEEERENIFKPFYTTKEKGTGLGLAVVLQAVYALGGEIEVSSIEGKGTTFTIKLPKEGGRGLHTGG